MRRASRQFAVSPHLRVFASIAAFAFCLLPFLFNDVAAHEPITTKVRFNKEVIRIFQRSCLGCHKPEGIAMSLATYEEARPWAKAIKEEMLEKRMPPWHAMKGYGDFVNAPALTQREIDLLVNWVEGGAPKGDDKDLPAGPLYSNDWRLGKPDLILKPATASEIASDTDEQRTIEFATNLSEYRWLAAIDFKPGNSAVVHCATFSYEAMRRTINKDQSISDPYKVPVSIGSWVPGRKAVRLPDGMAQLLNAKRILVKIHYRNSGDATTDSSEVGLYFTKPPRRHAYEIPITDNEAIIPAGAPAHRVKVSYALQDEVEAVGVRPLSHPLIASLQATAYRPDGTEEVLIWSRGYFQDWQQTYYLKQAAPLPKGTRVEVIAYFDNSDANRMNPNDPPKQMRLSEVSAHPLCSLIVAAARGHDAAGNR